jgi:hypothetical protein
MPDIAGAPIAERLLERRIDEADPQPGATHDLVVAASSAGSAASARMPPASSISLLR